MTSNHEGVSCDACRKNNFRGLRYKCLICYDYDLCSACYESGLTSSRHTVNHPMQCIVARNDYDLFYSGESISSEQPQSLTCPLCGELGFTEPTLLEHVTNEHANSDSDESSAGVVCPICGVETNQLTYDFATHLTMEHRAPRDQVEPSAVRRGARLCSLARSGCIRGRRSQPHHNNVGSSGSPSARDSNPIVEMLAQLSGVRRAGASCNQSPASHLHQLQMQLQSSPSFSRSANNSDVRIMRRTFQSMNQQLNSSSTSTMPAPCTGVSGLSQANSSTHYSSSQPFILMDQGSLGANTVPLPTTSTGLSATVGAGLASGSQYASGLPNQLAIESANLPSTQYLLSSCMKPVLNEAEQQQREVLKADRSLFVQELLLRF